ncbi:biotin--[acetyl-CoA-carboxylase] ligase [Demequina sp. B12]|uniref:biotin--[acetyl-CoA-carboxylase] ligase n=1 Tax=Demequina sp. B12 TaxID=2992757 RepID=UPI00237A3FD9|nr:biotin--[acetyl-CoA-carboxylase] ligase [Demequina sp. B12]MDE0573609.1 biotin--[acetyl-CoA-carboxylase] ligase [Demequina sp. B12]
MTPSSSASVSASRQPLTADALAGLVGPGRQLARLEVTATSPSTNTVLLDAARREPDEWPEVSAVVTDHQTAGRGRAGRAWATPQGAALTASFLLRPTVPGDSLGWAPLVTGYATVMALRDAGVGAYLKWPNDVVVEAGAKAIPGWGRWRKVVGILCEMVPRSGVDDEPAIVAGIGVNVSQSSAELPVPHAASLATLGATRLDRVALFRSLVAHLHDAVAMWEADADLPRVHAAVESVCASVGWDVTVAMPGGEDVKGRVTGLSDSGALLVATRDGEREVLAGDLTVRRA